MKLTGRSRHLITEYLQDGPVVARAGDDLPRPGEAIHVPPVAVASADAHARRDHLDALTGSLKPLIGLEAFIELSDVVTNLEVAIRDEYLARLVAVAREQLDLEPIGVLIVPPADSGASPE